MSVRKTSVEIKEDLLTADHDYDLIAEVTRQPAEWVVERGSV